MKIKQLLLLLSFCYSFTHLHAQEKHFSIIRDEICDCITELKSTKDVGMEDVKKCMQSAILSNYGLIKTEVLSAYPDSLEYKQGYAYGQTLGRRLDTSLVYSCDTYYRLTDSARFDWAGVYNTDSIKGVIADLTSKATSKEVDFYEKRAILYLFVEDYAKAVLDAAEVLKSKPYHPTALLIKGIGLENSNRFEDAMNHYYKVAALTGRHNYLVWAAINRRKSAEGKQP